MKIYIIAQLRENTRHIIGASSTYENAEYIAETLVDSYLAYGYYAPKVQTIINEQQEPGEPVVVKVYRLHDNIKNNVNIEIYCVNEIE